MGRHKICQNVSTFYMQLFFIYIKRYRGREENFENFFKKWVCLMGTPQVSSSEKVIWWKIQHSLWNVLENGSCPGKLKKHLRGVHSLTFMMLMKHFSTFHAENVITIFGHLLCLRNTFNEHRDLLKEIKKVLCLFLHNIRVHVLCV